MLNMLNMLYVKSLYDYLTTLITNMITIENNTNTVYQYINISYQSYQYY
jgi:hypothetical protein